jgi:hypothetical protein
MKRKIIKRNKAKMTFWIQNPFIYMVVHRNKDVLQESKYRHKYKQVFDYKNAYKLTENSERIMCPILISSKIKRSRVKNKLHAYRSFKNLEQLNEECGTNLKIEEIHVGWL